MFLTWQNVEVGKVVEGEIGVCEYCLASGALRPGTEVSVTSADFSYCSVCGRYEKAAAHVVVKAKVVMVDECDCEGRIAHNNGGNYHYAYLTVLEVGEIHLFDDGPAYEAPASDSAPHEEDTDDLPCLLSVPTPDGGVECVE